jgi:hypothetical protein
MPTPETFQLARSIAGSFHAGVRDVKNTLVDLFGVKLSRNEEPAWLSLDTPGFVIVNAGTTGNQAIMTMDTTYDFVAAGVAQYAHIIGDARAGDRPFQWNLQLSSNDRTLTNFQTHSDFLGGRHVDGFLWFSKLKSIARNSIVRFTLDALSADNLWVWMCLFGYRIYDEEMQDLTS